MEKNDFVFDEKHWNKVCHSWDYWDEYSTDTFRKVINDKNVTMNILKKMGENFCTDVDDLNQRVDDLNQHVESLEKQLYEADTDKEKFLISLYMLTKKNEKDSTDLFEFKKNIKKLFKNNNNVSYIRDVCIKDKIESINSYSNENDRTIKFVIDPSRMVSIRLNK